MSNPTELPDLDKLEAYATSSKNGDWHATEAMLNMLDEDDVLALVAAARRAQPEGEAPQAVEFYRHRPDQNWIETTPDRIAHLKRYPGFEYRTLYTGPIDKHAESGKERGSIEDCNEFNRLLDLYCDSQSDNYAPLVAYIDKWVDRRAAQLDGGQEGSESNG